MALAKPRDVAGLDPSLRGEEREVAFREFTSHLRRHRPRLPPDQARLNVQV